MSLTTLPNVYRFAIYNAMASSLSSIMPTVHGVLTRYDSTGSAVYGTNTTFFSTAATSLGAGSYQTGSTFSNTSGWLGGDFLFSAFASGSLSGSLLLFIEASPDSSTWPSPTSSGGLGGGLLVATLGWASTTTISTASTTRVQYFTL